jgi:hypothetical protein
MLHQRILVLPHFLRVFYPVCPRNLWKSAFFGVETCLRRKNGVCNEPSVVLEIVKFQPKPQFFVGPGKSRAETVSGAGLQFLTALAYN